MTEKEQEYAVLSRKAFFVWCCLNSDGSFVLTRQDIEAFFRWRFDELKRMVSELSLAEFCSDDLYNIKYTIEQRYETYTVLITEPDNEYQPNNSA